MRSFSHNSPGLRLHAGLFFLWIAASCLLAACQPALASVPTASATRTPRPTRTTTPTSTPTPTPTATPTPIPSLTSTSTATSTRTSLPTQTTTLLPGIGALRQEVQDFYKQAGFDFDTIGYQNGEYTVKAFSPTGFTKLSLYGEPDYLTHAEIEIITTGEAARLSTMYWKGFLDFTTPDGKRAIDWVWGNYRRAASNGRVDILIGNVRIVLEVGPKILKITVLPNKGSGS